MYFYLAKNSYVDEDQQPVRHIYFIAETKGSMDNLQLRKIEESKICCAEKLFDALSAKLDASSSDMRIRYGKVSNFDELRGKLSENAPSAV
ncbi:MAG TPA: hypothetical protein DCO86_00735 [Spirochaetaceae bacterium]|nr:hypothetical protein [Spirochaetaceae bacterium]